MTPDLDALAALLAAYDKAWDQLPSQAKLEDTLRSLRALGAWVLANRESLIEAARREAGLREALIWCSGADDFAPGGKAREGFEKIVFPLLHDNAVAALPAEGTEERVP